MYGPCSDDVRRHVLPVRVNPGTRMVEEWSNEGGDRDEYGDQQYRE
jgi:hypothetical protein